MTFAVVACLQSCVTAPKEEPIVRGTNDPIAAPAICKVKATRVAGVIQIELPKFESQLQGVREALIPVLKEYVEDTMALKEGESKEFEIDLNALMKTAKESVKDESRK
jgi:hypothetical protein